MKLRKEIAADPWMKICCHPDCSRKPEWEHAWIYAGKQINEKWAIIPVCEYHHRGPGLDKDFNRRIALSRATDADLAKYPKRNWTQEKIRLGLL